jgi:hypothetical protein
LPAEYLNSRANKQSCSEKATASKFHSQSSARQGVVCLQKIALSVVVAFLKNVSLKTDAGLFIDSATWKKVLLTTYQIA